MKESERNIGWKQKVGRAAGALGIVGLGYVGVNAKTSPPDCFQEPLPIGQPQYDYENGILVLDPIRISQTFSRDFHRAIDIAANLGTPVTAAAEGKAVRVISKESELPPPPNLTWLRIDRPGEDTIYKLSDGRVFQSLNEARKAIAEEDEVIRKYGFDIRRAGHHVLLAHGSRSYTLYAHLEDVFVKRGEYVRTGQTLGTVGNTGWSTGPHLHFEVRSGNNFIDPLEVFCDNNLSYWLSGGTSKPGLLAKIPNTSAEWERATVSRTSPTSLSAGALAKPR